MHRREFLLKTAAASTLLSTGRPAPRRRRPYSGAKAHVQAEVRAALRHVRELGRQGPARSAALHGRPGLHGARGQRHDGPAPELQQQIGDLMTKLGIDDGRLRHPDRRQQHAMFTTGKPENAGNFVKACTAAVDVAKRVQREVDDGRARQLRAPAADRHSDRPRHRHAARRRRRPREGQPGDGARAAERHAGPVPADVGSRPT